jgi:hypothetical protein
MSLKNTGKSNLWFGRKHKPETIEKMKLNRKQYVGENACNKKMWMFLNIKENKEYIIIGSFKNFCLENNLSYRQMRKIVFNIQNLKQHRGWTVKEYVK